MYHYLNETEENARNFFTYDLLDAQTLETVFDSLTREETQEIIDKYPNEYLVRNIEYDQIFA